MVFAMERPQFSKAISSRIVDAITDIAVSEESKSTDLVRVKTLLHLISDILFNSVQTTEAWSYVRNFEQAMPILMLHLNAKLAQSTYGKMSREKLLKDVKSVFQVWTEKSIFDERLTTGWMATLVRDTSTYLTFTTVILQKEGESD